MEGDGDGEEGNEVGDRDGRGAVKRGLHHLARMDEGGHSRQKRVPQHQ